MPLLLNDIQKWRIFILCKEFHSKLKLEECESGPSSSSSSSLASSSNFSHNITLSEWNKRLIKKLKVPFIEKKKKEMLDSLSSFDIKMGLGFRFLPRQEKFIIKELKLPVTYKKMAILSKKFGLSYNCSNFFTPPLSSTKTKMKIIERSRLATAFSSLIHDQPSSTTTTKILERSRSGGTGLSYFIPDSISSKKILVEAFTQYDGRVGRILVLVCLGVGCTAWYKFTPGSFIHNEIMASMLEPLRAYDPFFNMDYSPINWGKATLVEKDASALVISELMNENPFHLTEEEIPASGPVFKAVAVGLMVAFFLTAGLIPDVQLLPQ